MEKKNVCILKLLIILITMLSIILTYIPISSAASSTKIIDIVEITDLHGYLYNTVKMQDRSTLKQQIGAILANEIKKIKNSNPNTIILAAGDMFQGTPVSNILKGKPVIDMMKNIGFDAMTIGNHEYDWGIDAVIDTKRKTLKNSDIPVLGANIYDKNTKKIVNYCQPYVVVNKANTKIGIIGVVDNKEFPNIILPAYIKNVEFKDPVFIVNNLARKLRSEGVKIIVVLAHMGGYMNNNILTGNIAEFAKNVKGVDIILGGHTHSVVNTKINGIPVCVANCQGKGYIHIKVKLKNGVANVVKQEYVDITPLFNISNPPMDKEVLEVIEKADKQVSRKFSKVIGTAVSDITREQRAKPYGDSALGNWATDAIREFAHTDFAFTNNGGLRIDLKKGPITLGDIYQLMPFDNTIVILKMKGSQIKTILEEAVQDNGKGIQVSGLTFKYDMKKPSMNRVYDMKMSNGTPIEMDKVYTVATNNFMATGGDGFKEFTDPSVAKTYTDTYKLLRDVFIEKIQKQKELKPSLERRIFSSDEVSLSLHGYLNESMLIMK
ncbi:5'-Nucleotidase domain-containing protein [Caldicellulosiruptor kronotskyensis 2002]|uniref:5'-Nucleotidase domain-containing protein n=1 Tax=Caldicellulosiruptor kronotskyensis (strain DSM 18902 / VKM B-2412 / 2002) TaxID=632348 RepID=E4SG85_CALK2|nr:5'-nucleotidase C-terminal domain-containing protein [Caldicellulosiruptor kronotskyensis]ADQ46760.1 5'-Nucleotidase domain-containing protein [Caldicellulosiruptor kronotskyensis 2002]